MNSRYHGKVVAKPDNYSVVVNIGSDHHVKLDQEFLIVGLGETIIDPDSGEILEQLEIVKGKVTATHVQQKISTLTSLEVERDPDVREIKRKPSGSSYATIFGDRESVVETTRLGAERKKTIPYAEIGDYILKI
jgi:hypothetical protein